MSGIEIQKINRDDLGVTAEPDKNGISWYVANPFSVLDGDNIYLGRSSHFQDKYYTVLDYYIVTLVQQYGLPHMPQVNITKPDAVEAYFHGYAEMTLVFFQIMMGR
jgi:hypothetical protein